MNEQNTTNAVVEAIENNDAVMQSSKLGKVAIGAGIVLAIGAAGYGVAKLVKKIKAKRAARKASEAVVCEGESETTENVRE